jgi:hypothetical protein
MPLEGNVYTLDEAAEHLRLTTRGVAKIAKQHGLCMVRGRDILFTDADIEGIKEVMRVAPAGPLVRPQVTPALSDAGLARSLFKLTVKDARKR